jgi:hypothetical protein
MRLRPTFLSLVALTAVAGACANQSEGEVCDPNAGNDDCQAPLTCMPIPARPGTQPSFGYSRCCPPMGTPATTNVCSTFNTGFGGANPPPDASPGDATPDASAEAAVVEASTESGPDAGADGSDAVADAPREAAE